MKTLSLLVVLSTALFALADAGEGNTNSAGLTDNPIYQKNCAKCHGKAAGGRHFGGPALISEKAASASVDDLRNIITNGKGHMPKFSGKLTDSEVDALVAQIKTANAK